MNKNKLTINELADIFNSNYKNNNDNDDKRMSREISVRRIRDYITKKIVSEGIRDGKKKYYNQTHIEEISKARELHDEGFSDNEIIKFINNEQKEKSEKDNINDLINNIKKRKENKPVGLGIQQLRANIDKNLSFKSQIYLNKVEKSEIEKNKIKSTLWKEIEISEDVILKIKSNNQEDNKESILEKLKEIIIKIQEN